MKQSLISKIIAFIFGNKYYANIVNSVGTNRCEVCNFIFNTREEAAAHVQSIMATRSFLHVETISFRSRIVYSCRYLNDKGQVVGDVSVAK